MINENLFESYRQIVKRKEMRALESVWIQPHNLDDHFSSLTLISFEFRQFQRSTFTIKSKIF